MSLFLLFPTLLFAAPRVSPSFALTLSSPSHHFISFWSVKLLLFSPETHPKPRDQVFSPYCVSLLVFFYSLPYSYSLLLTHSLSFSVLLYHFPFSLSLSVAKAIVMIAVALLSPLFVPSWSSGQFLNGSYCSFEDGLCGWQTIAGKGPSWRSQSSLPKGLRPSCPSSGILNKAFSELNLCLVLLYVTTIRQTIFI